MAAAGRPKGIVAEKVRQHRFQNPNEMLKTISLFRVSD